MPFPRAVINGSSYSCRRERASACRCGNASTAQPSSGQLRAQLGRQTAAAPTTPAESMKIAAKAMSDALSTALTLVAHANDQAQNTLERRLPKYRRAWDTLEDVD